MYQKKNIVDYSNKYLKIAYKELSRGRVDTALNALYHFCAFEHLFNIELRNAQAEDMAAEIAVKYFPFDSYEPTDTILLYDSVAITDSALSRQYLTALSKMKCKVVYIVSGNNATEEKAEGLIEIAKSYGMLTEIICSNGHRMESIVQIRKIIARYRPVHIFLHMSNDDVYGDVAFSNMKSAVRYYINHGDEQFWLGTNAADYVIEFRGMGLDTSVRYRGFKETQCLVNPYYPIIKQAAFQGFDFDIPKDKVVLFSGGRFVKVYSESGKFLDIIKQILKEKKSAFFIFAGSGNDGPMRAYVEKNGLGDRWKVIHYRSDLLEVMKHVDIYLGTYPQSGALMTQYAAAAGTPLVEMNTHNGGVAEDMLPKLKDWSVTVDSWQEYLDRVSRLVNDREYRMIFAAAIKDSLISEEEFTENLKNIIETKTSPVPYVRRETNIELRSSRLLEAENSYLHRVPGIMSNKLMLRNYPLTWIYNFMMYLYFHRIKRLR